MVQNGMLGDPRLSLKTKGLFAVMLSKPGSWQFSVGAMAREAGVGRDAIRGCLKELREAGYLTVEKQSHGVHGKFGGSVYLLHDESCTPWPDFPSTAEPSTAEPSTENPTQVNTDLVNTDPVKTDPEENDPPIAPKGGRARRHELTEEAASLLREYAGADRELGEVLGAFMDIRRAKKAVNSARAIRMLLAELDRMSGGDRGRKLLLLRQSVTNSWKGIFPLKGPQAPPEGERTVRRYVE